MDFSLFYQLRNSKSRWIDYVFYFTCFLLVAAVFCYSIFTFKVYFQKQKVNELDKKILIYSTEQHRESEKKIIDYKKKIDDFTMIINNHRISLNVFSFIEQNTLPNVWFSSFNVSEIRNEINLAGESENMEALSSQVKIFEGSKDYVKSIGVLNFQVVDQGKIRFTVKLSLDPKIFAYSEFFIGLSSPPGNIINSQ